MKPYVTYFAPCSCVSRFEARRQAIETVVTYGCARESIGYTRVRKILPGMWECVVWPLVWEPKSLEDRLSDLPEGLRVQTTKPGELCENHATCSDLAVVALHLFWSGGSWCIPCALRAISSVALEFREPLKVYDALKEYPVFTPQEMFLAVGHVRRALKKTGGAEA